MKRNRTHDGCEYTPDDVRIFSEYQNMNGFHERQKTETPSCDNTDITRLIHSKLAEINQDAESQRSCKPRLYEASKPHPSNVQPSPLSPISHVSPHSSVPRRSLEVGNSSTRKKPGRLSERKRYCSSETVNNDNPLLLPDSHNPMPVKSNTIRLTLADFQLTDEEKRDACPFSERRRRHQLARQIPRYLPYLDSRLDADGVEAVFKLWDTQLRYAQRRWGRQVKPQKLLTTSRAGDVAFRRWQGKRGDVPVSDEDAECSMEPLHVRVRHRSADAPARSRKRLLMEDDAENAETVPRLRSRAHEVPETEEELESREACPLCNRLVAVSALQVHANRCLDRFESLRGETPFKSLLIKCGGHNLSLNQSFYPNMRCIIMFMYLLVSR